MFVHCFTGCHHCPLVFSLSAPCLHGGDGKLMGHHQQFTRLLGHRRTTRVSGLLCRVKPTHSSDLAVPVSWRRRSSRCCECSQKPGTSRVFPAVLTLDRLPVSKNVHATISLSFKSVSHCHFRASSCMLSSFPCRSARSPAHPPHCWSPQLPSPSRSTSTRCDTAIDAASTPKCWLWMLRQGPSLDVVVLPPAAAADLSHLALVP